MNGGESLCVSTLLSLVRREKRISQGTIYRPNQNLQQRRSTMPILLTMLINLRAINSEMGFVNNYKHAYRSLDKRRIFFCES